MQSSRGFTLFELLLVVALITVISGMAIPVLSGSTARNSVWTASEQIGTQIRQARLKAISRNTRFRIRFDCPAAGQFRVLHVTGDPDIDTALDRCDDYQEWDSGVYTMPARVTYGVDPPLLEVNGRGVFTSADGIPANITVTHTGDGSARTLTMSGTGQINFEVF